MQEEMFDNEETKIDTEKLKRMIFRIYGIERENTKTNKYSEREMKEIIKKTIEGEVRKCY